MSEDQASSGKAAPVVIKKYANRRLYNTATSTYVTLEDLAAMVKSGQEFVVHDAKSNEDLTRQVLTQIIFEEENKGGAQNLLPVKFLRQLISFYGDQMQGLVPGYLELSMGNLMKEQDKFRGQMMSAMGFGGDGMKTLEDQAKRNMQMFNDAMKTFNPFAAMMGQGMGMPTSPPPADAPKPSTSSNDLQALKEQLAAMQDKLDRMGK